MVNGRSLEDELERISDFFDVLSVEQFEKIAFECGVGVIAPSEKSIYVEAIPKRYANEESMKKRCVEDATYIVTSEETEAA